MRAAFRAETLRSRRVPGSSAIAIAIDAARRATGVPVAPHVAARLDGFARGDPAATAELARALSPAQLRGEMRIPARLPVTPEIRRAVADDIDRLSAAQRRIVFFAALSASDRADVVLTASGVDIRALLEWESPELAIRMGRYSFRDARIAAVVADAMPPAERAVAHRSLARAFLVHESPQLAAWHHLLGSGGGVAIQTSALLDYARGCLAAGNADAAQTIAEAVAQRSRTGLVAAQAEQIVATAALWGGHLADAERAAQRAARSDDRGVTDAARTVLSLVAAARSRPASGADRIGAIVQHKSTFGAAAVAVADHALFRTFAAATRRWHTDPYGADGAWARYVVTRPAPLREWPWDPGRNALTPLGHAFECLAMASVQEYVGDLEAARITLEEGVGRLPLAVPYFGMVSSYVRDLIGTASAGVVAEAFDALSDASPMVRVLAEDVLFGPLSAVALRHNGQVLGGLRSDAARKLTPREQEVVELAIGGRSDAVIGTHLGISPRTVETHLGRVYRKLGVRSRSELVALMLTPVSDP